MKMASVSTFKNRLSAYLDLVRRGEEIVITDRGRPVARLMPLATSPVEDTEAWRQGLEGRGIIRRASMPPSAALLDDLPPAPTTTADAVAASVEERRTGR
jgi:prevent-host-death family protein